ncbi:major histocompatibility complex class I-related protein 1-like [Brachyhypopomus gauderio]|uniref:major histocompatibility complex class I-related protein 1-like n=1 Tax=Brachyhypopomus gauderio TaxID=698409 RepID=UPI004042B7A8
MASCNNFRAGFIILILLRRVLGDLEDGEQQYCAIWMGSEGYALPKFTEMLVQNDVTIYYHDSSLPTKMPKPDWLNSSEGEELWSFIQLKSDYNRHILTSALESAVQQFNHTGSSSNMNVYQSYGCCWLYPDGTYKASLTHAFNGMDFLSFDLDRKAFTATVSQALVFMNMRNKDTTNLDVVTTYYKKTCLKRIKMFKHSPQVMLKKVPAVRISEKQRGNFTVVTCHVTGFYPRAVQVDWLGPDQQPGQGHDVLPNDDNTYQTRRTLRVAKDNVGKHNYSCVVLHSSIPGNITMVWVWKDDSDVFYCVVGPTRSRFALWAALALVVLMTCGIALVARIQRCWKMN